MRVSEAFRTDTADSVLTLAGYLPAGYPDETAYLAAVAELSAAGFRILEIGIPPVPPGMDGRVIREAAESMARAGVGSERALQLGGRAARENGMAPVGMLYARTFTDIGSAACLDLFLQNDIHAILVPDMPAAEWEVFVREANARGIDPIGFAPPDADEDRLSDIVARARGFLYVPSYTGVTGKEFTSDESLRARFSGIRKAVAASALPVAVGFGIQRSSDVEAVRAMGADGAVIGTALVRAAGKGPEALRDFVQRIAAGRGAGAWKT
jgi:tryptophan synthase alpha chain